MAARKYRRAPVQNPQMGLLIIIARGSTAIKVVHTRMHNKILEDKTRTLIRPSDHDLPNQMYGAKTRLRPLRASCLFTRSRIYTTISRFHENHVVMSMTSKNKTTKHAQMEIGSIVTYCDPDVLARDSVGTNFFGRKSSVSSCWDIMYTIFVLLFIPPLGQHHALWTSPIEYVVPARRHLRTDAW